MCVKDYIRENWKVKFIQIKDISPVAIESITRFHPDLGKAFKRGQTQHHKKSDRLQSQKQQIVFNLQKDNRPFSIHYKNNHIF